MPKSIFTINLLPEISIEAAYTDTHKVEKVNSLLKNLPNIGKTAYDRACYNFGKMLAKYVRNCIRFNHPPSGVSWKPHSSDYLKKYNVKGFWNLSSQMLNSINIRKYQGNYYVGPKPDEKAIDPVNKYGRSRTSKLTLVQLARLLEGGTKQNSPSKQFTNDIPPRPLFRPSFYAVGGTERLKKYLVANIRKEVKKYI